MYIPSSFFFNGIITKLKIEIYPKFHLDYFKVNNVEGKYIDMYFGR